MEELSPGETRAVILEQHQQLRKELLSIEREALETLRENVHGEVLAADLRRFVAHLHRHMDFEEARLVPVLEQVDAWGPERVRRFQDEHVRQRSMLDSLIGDASRVDQNTLALLSLGFVKLLQNDMEEEEASVLSENLLRDDPIVIPEPE